ncbi:TRAP transporter small permease [Halovulum dunhuangense]|uniref:TRAP transporter small permease protein n=1 Tax=Halovulum dunhuangense TaxID=1505036 RepID=A0A849L7Z8_9RHOB|nr:TRAP transporter small permease [Halovulum dunhuangense]NNU82222.1 TRAP transporter small permease [Halovulum dunhuangense]
MTRLEGGPDLSGPLAFVDRFARGIDVLSRWVIVVMMAAMAILVSLQVFFRYALNSSIDFADEASRFFFVAAIFLALPHGIRRGVHVGIDLFVNMMPRGLHTVLFRISAAASAVLMIVILWTGAIATADKWNELMPTLPVSAGLYYLPVLFTGFHGFLHLVVLAVGGPACMTTESET